MIKTTHQKMLLPSGYSQYSNDINLTRRCLRISADILKVLVICGLKSLSCLSRSLKFPITFINILLQSIAVACDRTYPRGLKHVMLVALASMLLAASLVWGVAPLLLWPALVLTIYTHFIRTVYRISKLILGLKKYYSCNQKNERFVNIKLVKKNRYFMVGLKKYEASRGGFDPNKNDF